MNSGMNSATTGLTRIVRDETNHDQLVAPGKHAIRVLRGQGTIAHANQILWVAAPLPNLEIRKDEIQLILNDMAEAYATADPIDAYLPAETLPEDMEMLASTIKEANASLEWTAYNGFW